MDLFYICVASIAGFIFTIGWRVCFSRALKSGWKSESSNENIKDPKYMLVSLIGSLWVSLGVFLTVKYVQPANYGELLLMIVCLWLFFIVGLNTKYYLAAKVNSRVCLFHYFGNLFHLVITGIIIGL